MKKLGDLASPMSWLLCYVYVGATLIFVLRPSFIEFLVLVGVDGVAFFIMQRIDLRFFPKIFPYFSEIKDGISIDRLKMMDLEEKKRFFSELNSYPRVRALTVYVANFIKGIPAFLVMIFYWKHGNELMVQFVLVSTISLINFFYFYGIVFLEAHIYLSDRIREIHKEFDLGDVFKVLDINSSVNSFKIQEYLVFIFLFVFMVGLHSVILYNNFGTDLERSIVTVAAVSIVTLILAGRTWFLSRHFLLSNLSTLFQDVKAIGLHGKYSTLALNTGSVVSQFQQAVNSLILRLQSNEKELEALIVTEAERGKYAAVGEISALVAHDLSGPLHAALFYAAELKSKPDTEKRTVYVERIGANLDRAWELVRSLRARLRNESEGEEQILFREAHNHVIKLLKMQFIATEFEKIQFKLDPNLDDLIIAMSSTDFIHIMDNLYRNSINELNRSRPMQPLIEVSLCKLQGKEAVIHFRDNGSGLSSELFEQITAERTASREAVRFGLGLRLIRRLVEFHRGKLVVIDLEPGQGTLFELTCPIARGKM